MTDLIGAVEEKIRSHALLRSPQSVLVAVSGGLDSMVLLHVLKRLAEGRAWRLVVAHFNHQLRGRAGNADEALVRKSAESLGLECVSERADVGRFARAHKLSIEMAGRQLRHDFLARTCRRRGIRTVALAHHADDQVELFFLRLLRGAGSEGLGGMDWVSRSPSDPDLELIRPFLGLRKADLRAWADQQGVRFREDLTNTHWEHQRNRIRGDLLPRLTAQYQPALANVVLRVMEILRAESDFVLEAARSWKRKQIALPFDALHVAAQRRLVQIELADLGVPWEFDLIERLRRSPGEIITVNPNLAVWRDEHGTIQSRPVSKSGFNLRERILDLAAPEGHVTFDGIRITWQIQPWRGAAPPKRAASGCGKQFDAGKVGSPVWLRHWRPGDRFQPIGMPSAVKVQDLFTNAKIPRERRRQLVVAATAQREIFWIEGLRMSEGFKLGSGSVARLSWQADRE